MARIVDFYQRIYRARAVDKICSKKTRIFVHGIPYSPWTPSLGGGTRRIQDSVDKFSFLAKFDSAKFC